MITGADISNAQAVPTGVRDDYSISFAVNMEGAIKLGDWTERNIGKHLAIVLDKKVLSAPVIQGKILDSGQIDGKFKKASAEELALSLRSGYLPATLKIVEEKKVENPFYRKD